MTAFPNNMRVHYGKESERLNITPWATDSESMSRLHIACDVFCHSYTDHNPVITPSSSDVSCPLRCQMLNSC
jgi:hypothetical protein